MNYFFYWNIKVKDGHIFFFYEKNVVLLAMLRGVEMSLLFYVIVLIVNQFTVNVVTLSICTHVRIYT